MTTALNRSLEDSGVRVLTDGLMFNTETAGDDLDIVIEHLNVSFLSWLNYYCGYSGSSLSGFHLGGAEGGSLAPL